MIKLMDLLSEAQGRYVWIVYLRQSPKRHWQLNLVEPDKARAIHFAKKWKQEMIEHGQKNGKKWDVQAAIEFVSDFSGKVDDYDGRKSLSPNAMNI